MGNITSWPSPAKINLFLHINGRRPDGYHELQSIFVLFDKGDTLDITPRDDNAITITPDLGFPVESNIVFKAARILKEYTGREFGADIHINKNIPMGGGLGGGSSNAATALVALNLIFKLGLDEDTLATLGRKLGADVPVFVRGRSAFAEGVGEILTPVNIEEKYYLIATPTDTSVSTAEIFNHPELPRNTPKLCPADVCFENTRNDCEKLVKKYYPKVAKTLSWLLQYAPSRMTGTGASCFACFEDEKAALAAFENIPNDMRGFVAKAVNVSPLKEAADSYNRSNQKL